MGQLWRNFIVFFCAICVFLPSAFASVTVEGLANHERLYDDVILRIKNNEKIAEGQPLNHIKLKSDINKILRARGYYGAHVSYILTGGDITFNISPGNPYKIVAINVIGYTPLGFDMPKLYEPLDAYTILNAQQALKHHILKEECFFDLNVVHRARINHVNQTATVYFEVKGENNAVFGATDFVNVEGLDRTYLQRFLAYKAGDCWSLEKVEETKSHLFDTTLLSGISTDLPEVLLGDKNVPVVFNLKKRKWRKYKLGARYSTFEGPGVSASWIHRNAFGAGEEVEVGSDLSRAIQKFEIGYKKPFLFSPKNKFEASVTLTREDTDAFETLSFDVDAFIKRKMAKYWTGQLGVSLETLTVKEDAQTQDTFGFLSFPAQLDFDNRDDVLNPHKGHLFSVSTEGFVDAFGQSDPFVKSRVTGTAYFDLSDSRFDPVLALRSSIGSILGSSTESIPASKRFFTGGGGTIRGFGYQEAGPFDDDNDPAGGRSLFEVNAEMRVKFTNTIGAVAFVDGGGVYDNPLPNFTDQPFIGAGLGLRYYTDFGPLRFDVATPLTEKENADENVQIYISIGQAF